MIRYLLCGIVFSLSMFATPQSVLAAEQCICNTSIGSAVQVPFANQRTCEIPVTRPHPIDTNIVVLNCAWGEPAEAAEELEAPENFDPSLNGNSSSQVDNPRVQEIQTQLRGLNRVSASSIPDLIGRGLRLFTGFFGSIALIMVIYGGIEIMVAGGQSDKIKQGTSIIVWASIGLTTMILSYVLVQFVFGVVT